MKFAVSINLTYIMYVIKQITYKTNKMKTEILEKRIEEINKEIDRLQKKSDDLLVKHREIKNHIGSSTTPEIDSITKKVKDLSNELFDTKWELMLTKKS